MRTRLLIPGWGGSGPDHWQTRWERDLRGARKVELPGWFEPAPGPWIEATDRAVVRASAASGQPPIIIAHSLGCVAVAAWAARHRRPIAAAMLVAPCDCEDPRASAALRAFAPMPRVRLPFPTRVVVSDDDPYITVAAVTALAAAWGAALTLVAGAGHLNAASGHGAWPEGQALLRAHLAAAAA